jgi:serpin B
MNENGLLRAGRGATFRAAVLLLGCGLMWNCASPAAGAVGLATSDASRAPANEAEAQQAAESLDAFGFDMYGRLDRGTNLVFSPASVYIALSMAAAGARGETATQMDAVLHQPSGAASGNGVNSLDQALATLSQTWTDPGGTKHEVRLNIANAPFAQSGMNLQPDYLDTLASRYGAGLRLVDYAKDLDGATRLINEWVSDRTEKRIPHLIDSLDPLTRLVLVNAIYLKAPWSHPFEEDLTADAPFTRADGSTVTVPTMNGTIEAAYAEGGGWRAAELPYAGGSLAITIVVPSDLAAFEAGLDGAQFASIVEALGPARVKIAMPRFETETRAELSELLESLGMPLALDPKTADFSGITTSETLFISAVIHQANITVDEKGTEAAAATAVALAASAAPIEGPKELKVDRPFLFALRDTKTGAILFLGRIVDPSAGM